MPTEILRVEGVLPSGAGTGTSPGTGLPLILPGALPGDRVRAAWREPSPGGRQGLAQTVEILERSPWRTGPRCPKAGLCGGCPLGGLEYRAGLELKTRVLLEAPLKSAGLWREGLVLDPVAQPEGCLSRFRNKAILYPLWDGESLRFGFFQSRSHDVVPAEDCPQAPLWMERAAISLGQVLSGLPAWAKPSVRALLLREGAGETERLAAVSVTSFPDQATEKTLEAAAPGGLSLVLHRNALPGNAVLDLTGGETRVITGSGQVTAEIGGLRFAVRPETFLQVNTPQTPRLYGEAFRLLELTPEDDFLDLYCGVGTMTLLGARRCRRAVGVEVVEASVEAARENARINGIGNARFAAGPVERVLPHLDLAPAKAIVDPSFRGMDQSVPASLARLPLRSLVYVSCSPKTLARDARRLTDLGFELQSVTPVDMFPEALHLEAVALFTRDALP